MKSFVKTLFIFFILLISLCINPQIDTSLNTDNVNYIQNNYQKVFIVSNQINSGEIAAKDSGNDLNSGGNNFASSIIPKFDDKFINKSTLIEREFIHNLSTNLKHEIFIRAG